MSRFSTLAVAACLLFGLAACDSTDANAGTPGAGFDPSTIDYDSFPTADFETQIRPLLAARNVLSPTTSADAGNPADYSLDALVMAGPSGFIVPFDAEGSLMVRFVADMPDSSAIPFPNLRRLEADELRFVERWIEAGAKDGDRVPFSDSMRLLFACVQGENHVDILDEMTMRIIRRVHFGDHNMPSAPNGPHHVAFEPGGSAWYVTLVSGNKVVKLSTDLTMDPSDPAFVLGSASMTTPGMIAIDPSSDRMYVGRSTLSDRTTEGFVWIDRSTMVLTDIDTPFAVPHAMAVTPDGKDILTASLAGGKAAVYSSDVDEITQILTVPGGPHELIHFAVLGAHHDSPRASAQPAGMDHAGMDHGQMDHAAMGDTEAPRSASAQHGYEATLTSRSTDTILFFSLSEAGELSLTATAPAGDGPYHAHVGHDGRTMLIPDQFGDSVTILDAVTRTGARTVSASAPAGPLSQPHSPAPGHGGTRFFVTSSNLNGRWVAPYRFLGPAAADGRREALPAEAFSNVASFSMDGTVEQVVQLGAYASGLEPFMVGVGGHESMGH